jgi:predicted phage-related endonuclease
VKTIDYGNRDYWLQERSKFVGASDSPSLFGEGFENQNEFSLYAEKAEGVPRSLASTEAMEVGKAMEPVIRSLFSDRTAMEVVETPPYRVVFADCADCIGCTLDGEVIDHGERGVWEAKNVSEYEANKWRGEDPPLRVQIQVQHQLLCTGFMFGYAAGLLGGNRLVWRRIERNEKFINALITTLSIFWRRILTRQWPVVDGSAATREALKRLYPHDTGEEIGLPLEAQQWDRRLCRAKGDVKYHQGVVDQHENLFKAAIGTASIGVLPGGGRYTYREQTRKAHPMKASTFRVLRREKK